MIAYVFWHWKKREIATEDYEKRQGDFHAALAASPPAGFLRSFCAGVARLPWTGTTAAYGVLAERVLPYEDWYLVEDFAALGFLNEGAVSGSRSKPHDAAAAAAEDGAGALYALRLGDAETQRKYALWFSKPGGMSYAECYAELEPVITGSGGVLWVRLMALGPARELCALTEEPLTLPAAFEAIQTPLRRVWPLP